MSKRVYFHYCPVAVGMLYIQPIAWRCNHFAWWVGALPNSSEKRGQKKRGKI